MVPAPTKLTVSGITTKSSKRNTTKRPSPASALRSTSTSDDSAPSSSSSRLQALASSLPSELITYILEFAASTTTHTRHKITFLLLSRPHHTLLSPHVYSTVALCSSSSIHSFASFSKIHPSIARLVRRIWIGPDTSSSDLITALSPPSFHEPAYITDLREHVHASVRTILRSCRKLQDVALAGELLSLHSAHTYGSACQPVRLTSINPHSFVGGFSAPIFRKVRVLRIVDTNLAFEEADEIRTLSELEWLIWSAPKDYGDITRDSNVLRRLLQRPRKHFDQPNPGEEGTDHGNTLSATSEHSELFQEMAALELNEGLAPARPSKNDKFRRLTIQTSHTRASEFRTRLADTYPLLTPSATSATMDSTGGLAGGLDSTFQDLERDWDPHLNVPTIHPTTLAGVVLDEWDALRDLINNAGGHYSTLSMFDDGEAIVDAGNALQRQRSLWESTKDIGLPTTPLIR